MMVKAIVKDNIICLIESLRTQTLKLRIAIMKAVYSKLILV